MSARRKRSTMATYIVIREGLPTNAFSGIDLMLLLWNPLEEEKNNYRQSHVCEGEDYLIALFALPVTTISISSNKSTG